MEIKHLVTFREVARTQSFSRAAESLNYAQSTITAQIQILEQELAAPLFHRYSKSIALTIIGERLLPYADQIVSLEADARISIKKAIKQPSGRIMVDATDAILFFKLPKIIRKFNDLYPEVELVFNTRHVDELVDLAELVRSGVIESAFIQGPKIDDDLNYELISYERSNLFAAPHHPLAEKGQITPEDLDTEVIFFMMPDCPYRKILGDSLNRFKSSSIHNFMLKDFQSIKQQVLLGRGISILCHFEIESELQKGDLVTLQPSWMNKPIELPIWLVWNADRWQSPASKAFHEVVRKYILN